jgi:hypothetical protein
MSKGNPDDNTDVMIHCLRLSCRFNCQSKENFCTKSCVHINGSSKCVSYARDAKKVKKLYEELT